MLLATLVEHLEFSILQGDTNTNISSIAFDSREVVPNGLFVAITGFTVDGHQYIQRAVELGATAILVEKDIKVDAPITILKVADTRYAMAHTSARFYSDPTENLNLIGITGTNGKTSTTYFIKSILEQSKRTVGVIGTIGAMVGNQSLKTKSTTPTTPESLHLQHMFADMVETGVHDCVMEVSSHALSLQRTAASRFKSGIFTNLTPDHLELHNTMEEYFEAKAMLFDLTTDYNIVNIDDEYGRRLAAKISSNQAKLVTYGIENEADIRATDIRQYADYTSYIAHTPTGSIAIQSNLPGLIYVYNSLAAVACAYCNGISLDQIAAGIRAVESIKGRLEVVYQDDDRKIIVDFAHTEDSLEKALSTLRPFTKGRLLLVFGVYAAPGQLGSGKRQAMGKIAAAYSDIAIVTSDNPKDQDPDTIIAEVSAAVEAAGGTYRGIVDRREAIQYAIDISEKDDVILIAGKGHETSQVIGKTEIPFNEAEIVNEIMSSK
ncbi:UDP-N-acetylmuramoyl-L-alanyl-D-glutamate--2,6-diaminopimelate ligase [Paenibacillus sp. GSMTC-2017]|uniref:UDP-N-acetylmuramoyl-L-alanyl-D-glutamate--2, 6-diaminopimelate ligase n=1 Tax=Paenibacillus sp. GSMTC-2017 TaxID=2794350 RepID=UPI0018D5AA0A|nr:UDP-N-acetylmuramoyl-L-alanyl-D-glutamate--2,6-diaminopimelate ligase [Paenibacillus sp. GSMTC-2017]MBH5320512.1 UDP-N-acetylmuramoyl-L-alanyl-D-glutamate--2,6-diaminopimelate ligase [Paenibacillus sp. GSMTC-2017]